MTIAEPAFALSGVRVDEVTPIAIAVRCRPGGAVTDGTAGDQLFVPRIVMAGMAPPSAPTGPQPRHRRFATPPRPP